MVAKSSKAALVTGASSTFGAAYACRLAERGYAPVLVARNEKRLAALAADIADRTGTAADVIIADLTATSGLEQVEERLRTDESIEMLVNSAGAVTFAPSAGFDAAKADAMIALNITAATRLTTAVLPGLTRRGRGTIVNVSSALAFWFLPGGAIYSAAKSYVLTFTQALQQELAGSGVTVQAVIPGAMSTGFWAGSGVELSTFPDDRVMSPQQAVDAALAGLDAGEAVTIPSLADIGDWDRFEKAWAALAPMLSRAQPADRYRG